MIIFLDESISAEQKKRANDALDKIFPGVERAVCRNIISIESQPGAAGELAIIEGIPGIKRVELAMSEAFPLATKRGTGPISVKIGKTSVGKNFTLIAGPCAVENRDNYLFIVKEMKKAGAHILRGAIFKPRSSPYAFQGIGKKGLEILREAKKLSGLPVLTELTDPRQFEYCADTIDAVQIGARNMRNYDLIKEAGKSRLPVILKRASEASLSEWMASVEYIMKEGNSNIILCERGDNYASDRKRSINFNIILEALEASRLPVIADPSHGSGKRSFVSPLAMAAKAVGACGIMVEVHQQPATSLVDAKQALSIPDFKKLAAALSD